MRSILLKDSLRHYKFTSLSKFSIVFIKLLSGLLQAYSGSDASALEIAIDFRFSRSSLDSGPAQLGQGAVPSSIFTGCAYCSALGFSTWASTRTL